eukprot:6298409-Amphidinium_carterae.1
MSSIEKQNSGIQTLDPKLITKPLHQAVHYMPGRVPLSRLTPCFRSGALESAVDCNDNPFCRQTFTANGQPSIDSNAFVSTEAHAIVEELLLSPQSFRNDYKL